MWVSSRDQNGIEPSHTLHRCRFPVMTQGAAMGRSWVKDTRDLSILSLQFLKKIIISKAKFGKKKGKGTMWVEKVIFWSIVYISEWILLVVARPAAASWSPWTSAERFLWALPAVAPGFLGHLAMAPLPAVALCSPLNISKQPLTSYCWYAFAIEGVAFSFPFEEPKRYLIIFQRSFSINFPHFQLNGLVKFPKERQKGRH